MTDKKQNLSPKTPTPAEGQIDELARSKGITHAAAAAELTTAKHNAAAEAEQKRKADSGKPGVSPETS